MYKNKNNFEVYLYSYKAGGYTAKFESEESLISFLSYRFNYIFGEYNELNMTWKDKTQSVDECGISSHVKDLTFYTIENGHPRVFDVRQYKEKAKSLEIKYHRYYYNENNYGEKLYSSVYGYGGKIYYFRCGPVAYTGSKRERFYHNVYRHPKTLNEMKKNESVFEQAYEYGLNKETVIRKRRTKLPTVWDDTGRGIYKSWKTQKKKKQWM